MRSCFNATYDLYRLSGAKLEIKKTGVNLVTMFLSPPEPYEVFDADLWECPSCGREIVAGVADVL